MIILHGRLKFVETIDEEGKAVVLERVFGFDDSFESLYDVSFGDFDDPRNQPWR